MGHPSKRRRKKPRRQNREARVKQKTERREIKKKLKKRKIEEIGGREVGGRRKAKGVTEVTEMRKVREAIEVTEPYRPKEDRHRRIGSKPESAAPKRIEKETEKGPTEVGIGRGTKNENPPRIETGIKRGRRRRKKRE